MFSFVIGTISFAGLKTIATGGGFDDFIGEIGEALTPPPPQKD